LKPLYQFSITRKTYFLKGNDSRKLKTTQCEELLKFVNQDQKGQSFLVYNSFEALRKLKSWQDQLLWIRPFYALKYNQISPLVHDLTLNGAGLDVSSQEEIRQGLQIGVNARDIIYSNPVKEEKDIIYAAKNNVLYTTADSFNELLKIQQLAPNMKILWRISIPVDNSKEISTSFLINLEMIYYLLKMLSKCSNTQPKNYRQTFMEFISILEVVKTYLVLYQNQSIWLQNASKQADNMDMKWKQLILVEGILQEIQTQMQLILLNQHNKISQDIKLLQNLEDIFLSKRAIYLQEFLQKELNKVGYAIIQMILFIIHLIVFQWMEILLKIIMNNFITYLIMQLINNLEFTKKI
ncbi:ornithine decarboxylase, putative, partial [Ichthyophthirius multifiliis]